MTMGAWRDRAVAPTRTELAAGIAPDRRPLWDALTGWIDETYGVEGEVSWTDAESGWVLRCRRGGRALTTLSPFEDGGFGALVVMGPTAWPAVETLPLSQGTREAWASARPYPDGRWLWLRVEDAAIVGDVEGLLALKSPPPRRVRRPAPVER